MTADSGDGKKRLILLLHEIFFSLNISYAITFAVMAFRKFSSHGGIRRSAVYFLLPGENLFAEVSDRANTLLRLGRGSSVGWEVASIASIVLLAALITLILQLARGTRFAQIVLGQLAIATSTALLPAFWLYAVQASQPPIPLYTFWRGSQPALTFLELSFVLGFLYLTRKRELSVLWRGLALGIYYLLWILLPWSMPFWSLRLLSIVFPLSGFLWLAYTKIEEHKTDELSGLPLQRPSTI